MGIPREKILEVAKEISKEIIGNKTTVQIAKISQDEIDVVLFPVSKELEDIVDEIVTDSISEATRRTSVERTGNWW